MTIFQDKAYSGRKTYGGPLFDNPKCFSMVHVLGASGFIGRQVCRALANEGMVVRGWTREEADLTDWDKMAELREQTGPDSTLVFCSAIKKHQADQETAFRLNTAMALNVSRLIRDHRPGRVIYFSSVSVYGEDRPDMVITEDTPAAPISLYGIAKFASERILATAARGTGTSLIILRPSIVYGPGDENEGYRPSAFAKALYSEKKITLWGDGRELRDFVFVEDVGEIVCRLVPGQESSTFILAAGESRSFREVIDRLGGLLGRKPGLSSKPRTAPKVDQGFVTDRLKAWLPDFVFTSLEDGLRKTCQDLGLLAPPGPAETGRTQQRIEING